MSVEAPAPGAVAPACERAHPVSTELTLGIVGLGYVGLQLAVQFGRSLRTIGIDLSEAKTAAYRALHDPSGEVSREELRAAARLDVSTEAARLAAADIVIVAVPTPVDAAHIPDFAPLLSACRLVGPHLKRGATVVFESTVYPGATEEVCIPELERASGRRWKEDFFVGYSPERINPGDREHGLTRVTKVVAGDTPATLAKLVDLYAGVIPAGVHAARSIRIAEAAKVIENTQRDLNIALMNELAVVFHRMGIDTAEVLAAARTKWNFLDFRPGLVGGHCIGVDPYYLTYAAEKVGHHPEVILSGRRINDGMGPHVARKCIQEMIHAGRNILGARVNVLGLTFKEDCRDIRNSKVIDVVRELRQFGVEVFVHDPQADPDETMHEYGIRLCAWDDLPAADALILAVAHKSFLEIPAAEMLKKIVRQGCLVQVKPALDPAAFRREGVRVWRL